MVISVLQIEEGDLPPCIVIGNALICRTLHREADEKLVMSENHYLDLIGTSLLEQGRDVEMVGA